MSNTGSRVIGFQEPATPVMEGIIDLHNYIFFYLAFIIGFVFSVLLDVIITSNSVYVSNAGSNTLFNLLWHTAGVYSIKFHTFAYNCFGSWYYDDYRDLDLRRIFLRFNRLNHDTNLEVIWTTLPSIILVFIAVPSLALLYSMDELLHPQLTFKATGYQWYWTYEFSDTTIKDNFLVGSIQLMDSKAFNSDELCRLYNDYSQSDEYRHLFFESYMISDEDVDSFYHHRLLSTDHSVVLPSETHIRVLVTSADVLHSWAVPSLGVKIDAVPGRLNQVGVYLKRQGVFYGQCSELCGANHAFMPIVIKSVSLSDFLGWVRVSMYSKWLSSLIL